MKTKVEILLQHIADIDSNSFSSIIIFESKVKTRAKQAQACKTATCLRISDIFTYLFRYLLIHSITY